MAAPSTPVLEAFTGIGNGTALSAYSPNWALSGDAGLAGELKGDGTNQVKTADASFYGDYWTQPFAAESHEAYYTLTAIPAGSAFDCFVRASNPGASTQSFYYIEYLQPTHQIALYRRVNGVDSGQLANSSAATLAAGDKMALFVAGTDGTVALEAWTFQAAAWTQRITFADTNAARLTKGTFIGAHVGGATGGAIDDFGGGQLAQGSGPRVPVRFIYLRKNR